MHVHRLNDWADLAGWRRQLRGPGVRHGPVHWELRVKHVCTGGDVKASPELPLLAGG